MSKKPKIKHGYSHDKDPDGGPIVDYVIEDRENRILTTLPTLLDAIEWAKQQGYAPLVTRIREMNDKAKPDHWREV